MDHIRALSSDKGPFLCRKAHVPLHPSVTGALLQEKTAGSPAAKNRKGIYVSVDPLGVLLSGRDERI